MKKQYVILLVIGLFLSLGTAFTCEPTLEVLSSDNKSVFKRSPD